MVSRWLQMIHESEGCDDSYSQTVVDLSQTSEIKPFSVLIGGSIFALGKDNPTFDEFASELVPLAIETGGLPRGALWALRGIGENLKAEPLELRESVCRKHSKIARALSIRHFLADTWSCRDEAAARDHFKAILNWCSLSIMAPFIVLGKV